MDKMKTQKGFSGDELVALYPGRDRQPFIETDRDRCCLIYSRRQDVCSICNRTPNSNISSACTCVCIRNAHAMLMIPENAPTNGKA